MVFSVFDEYLTNSSNETERNRQSGPGIQEGFFLTAPVTRFGPTDFRRRRIAKPAIYSQNLVMVAAAPRMDVAGSQRHVDLGGHADGRMEGLRYGRGRNGNAALIRLATCAR